METLSYPTKTKAYKSHVCNFCLFMIEKGSEYLKSSHKSEGEIYTWKSHQHCNDVLEAIGAWDDGDGVNADDFRECISSEYSKIMSDNFNDEYESKDFKIPNFEGRLKFVLDFHKISTTHTGV